MAAAARRPPRRRGLRNSAKSGDSECVQKHRQWLWPLVVTVLVTVLVALLTWNLATKSVARYVDVAYPPAGEAIAGSLRPQVVQLRRFSEARISLRMLDGTIVREAGDLSVEWSTESIPDGDYRLVVTVRERWFFGLPVMLLEPQVISIPVLVNNTPPILSVSGIRRGEAVSGSREVAISVEGGIIDSFVVSGMPRQVAAGVPTALVSLDTVALPDGEHELLISARSPSGLLVQERLPFQVDNTPVTITSLGVGDKPICGIVELRPDVNKRDLVAVSWMLDGVVIGTELLLDWDSTTVSDGAYRLELEVTDAAGNRPEEPEHTLIVVDNTPPTMKVALPDTIRGTFFRYSIVAVDVAADEDVTVRLLVNGDPIGAVGSVGRHLLHLSQYEPGTQLVLGVLAVDRAGNETLVKKEIMVEYCVLSLIDSLLSYDRWKLHSLLIWLCWMGLPILVGSL